ncbi:MAG: ParB/Srx family N-terminal domain-containing protein [Rhodomicrobium sp.]
MSTLKVSYRDPAQLRRRDRNPRTHTPNQIKQIAASIEEFGFINPVLIDGSGGIIAGHGRVEAAKLLGMGDIPTVCAGHLSPAQVRAYVIADNRLAELAGWDRKLLALELQELSVQPDFDVAITGFETAEVDILIGELGEEARTKPMSCRRSTVRGPRSRGPAISGGLGSIICSAATRWMQKAISNYSAVQRRSSFLPTRPTTWLLAAMSRVWARTNIANSRWRPAK